MINITDKNACCGCSACASACPRGCITMQADGDGFLYPCVDAAACTSCGLCDAACPMQHFQPPHGRPKAYGAINRDEEIRSSSSSGGVFWLLCRDVIGRMGVVFGAAFDGDFNVVHTYADTLEGCRAFMGSKYVAGSIGDSYRQAKRFLQQDREVLFTGTPCQIAGLYAYLGKLGAHEKLLTQDIVCHSVPSPKKWEEFRREISGGRQLAAVNFRNKETGWRTYSFVAAFTDGSEYREQFEQTAYMKGFKRGDYSRPSCYACPFSRLERQSDLTLGDFWGVEGLYPQLYDNKGTSLVLIHSSKGKKAFKRISEGLLQKKVRTDWAVKYNPAVSQRNTVFTGKK